MMPGQEACFGGGGGEEDNRGFSVRLALYGPLGNSLRREGATGVGLEGQEHQSPQDK